MMRFPTQEAESLRQSETRQSLTFALAFGVFTLVITVAAAVFGWMLDIPFAGYIAALVFTIGGLYVFFVLRAGWHRGSGVVNRVVEVAENWFDAEIKLKLAAHVLPPTPDPAPTPENRMIPHTVNGRVGELPIDLIDDWLDPRDADWFAKYLAQGNKWTETVLEKIPLPYSGQTIGKDRDNSPYHHLMAKCVAQEIITGRGGPGNPSGKLAITDEKEIARRLRIPRLAELTP